MLYLFLWTKHCIFAFRSYLVKLYESVLSSFWRGKHCSFKLDSFSALCFPLSGSETGREEMTPAHQGYTLIQESPHTLTQRHSYTGALSERGTNKKLMLTGGYLWGVSSRPRSQLVVEKQHDVIRKEKKAKEEWQSSESPTGGCL